MPVLKAPEGRTGQVSCSASGKNFDIDENGLVTVDACDISDLLRAGFSFEGSAAAAPAPASTFSAPAPVPDGAKPAEAGSGEASVEAGGDSKTPGTSASGS